MKDNNYLNPYVAGVILGIALFVTFLIAGQGMGASGAIARSTAQIAYNIDPEIAKNAYAGKYLHSGNALINWTVIEVLGIFIGGLISALLAGRFKLELTRANGYPVIKRVAFAFLGGFILAAATRITRGCTSGQALDGASAFSVGSWIFMLAAFGAGFFVAFLFKKQWKGVE
jgi:hypothetical protein